MTEEERRAGGVWVFGDRLPEWHPGHTDGSLVAKSWWSYPVEKYSPGGYPFKDRKDTGHWEYVSVIRGGLVSVVRDGQDREMRFLLGWQGRPREVDLPPSVLRRWELPAQGLPGEELHRVASGFALFRPLKAVPYTPGFGDTYEFAWWEDGVDDVPWPPGNTRPARILYLECFRGQCEFFCGTLDDRKQNVLPLTAGERAYVLGERWPWVQFLHTGTGARGVIIRLS